MARMSSPARTRVVTAGVVALLLGACGGTTTNDATSASASASAKPGAASSTLATAPAPSASRLAVRRVPPPRVATPAAEPLDPPAAEPLAPQGWSSRQLAAELIMTGAKMGDTAAIEHAATKGVGGVVLFGPFSPNLARTLTRARAAAPRGNAPLIASDEEGGQVQRLTSLIYPLPSAETMGRWGPGAITETARRYALRMRALGVSVALGPDADIAVPGYFISAAHRSFSGNPRQVGVAVNAWNDGLRAAGVLGVVKHWPGHGQASDTHVRGSSVPPWSVLQGRDLIPFKAAFAHHGGAVMVGHLRAPGLTEGSWPATESPAAMRALRAQAGTSALILTDDLSMAAASTTVGITAAQAAVRSLVAGADVAMVCFAPVDAVISAVAKAINDGRLSRARAVASARRILRVKTQVGR
jgi:beta-N-acetylhexosaminidase